MISSDQLSQEGMAFYERLAVGDERSCFSLLHKLREESGLTVLRLCEVLTGAFHQIGAAWECAALSVYREHVASQIGCRLLQELRAGLDPPEPGAPVAIGCTPEGDPYQLPTTMVELALRELGWQAQSLGTNLPLELLIPALEDLKPALCWVSVSYTHGRERLREQFSTLSRACQERGIPLYCGGREIGDDVRQLPGLICLDELRELRDQVACC